jgi:hypothetical protein
VRTCGSDVRHACGAVRAARVCVCPSHLRLGKLEHTLSRLHGVEAAGWDGTLANAEVRLRAAAAKVIAAAEVEGGRHGPAGVAAELEFDGWSKVISTHPAYIRREARRVAEWEAQNFDAFQAALYELRPLIPPDITRSSLAAVKRFPALQVRALCVCVRTRAAVMWGGARERVQCASRCVACPGAGQSQRQARRANLAQTRPVAAAGLDYRDR